MILRSLSPFVFALTIFGFTACAPKAPEVLSASSPLSFSAFQIVEVPPLASADCTTQPLTQFDNHSCQEMRQEFRYVVYVGTQVYCYWDLKRTVTNTDFDAMAKTLEAKITDQTSYTEYFTQVLKPWAALFRDGHVNAMPPDDLSRFEIFTSGAKLTVLAAGTDHESVVIAASTNPLLPAGVKITQINGEPIEQRLAAAADHTSGSTDRMRRFFAGAKLLDATGIEVASQPFTVAFIDPKSGVEKTVTPNRQLELDLPSSETATPAAAKSGAEAVEASILADNIGYLKITAFMGTRISEVIDAAMVRLKGTRGLIIDMRENGGGDQSGDRVLRWLSQAPIVRYIESPRHADFLLALRPDYLLREVDSNDARFYTWRPVTVAPTSASEGTYAGKPVVVLTSPHCFSACDTFVSALQSNHLALVVGEPTGGGTGSPLVFDLPISSMKFRYAVARGKNSQGNWIEGNGTLPDILAEAVASDVTRSSLDSSQLQVAYAQIQKPLEASSGPTPQPIVTIGHAVDPYAGVSASREELLRLQDLANVREN